MWYLTGAKKGRPQARRQAADFKQGRKWESFALGEGHRQGEKVLERLCWGPGRAWAHTSLEDQDDLLADDASSGFTVARLNLQGTRDCLPHFWLALFNIENRDADEGHLYASFLPQLHVIHGSLVRLSITAPEKFCWPGKKSRRNWDKLFPR